MKVLILIALLSAALAPHSIAAVVASKATAPGCGKDKADTVFKGFSVATVQSATKTGSTSVAR